MSRVHVHDAANVALPESMLGQVTFEYDGLQLTKRHDFSGCRLHSAIKYSCLRWNALILH